VKVSDVVYGVATGPERRRQFLTPVGAGVFFGLVAAVVVAGAASDYVLSVPRLLPGAVGVAIGLAVVVAGLAVWVWCVALFWKARGTPVPANPPRELVVDGPYSWVRNPMLTGVFATLFGLGFMLHSVSLVFVWTPIFMVLNAIELKLVEEPELERRLGASYVEYRHRVPMFIPRLRGRRE
jgi:protein-S-isoprenylcysteine O-methyltransferase Ste14